jgi:NAD(P)H-hydrate repair Nnr-like enzyme with NAD(P)H-hydrate dehydratase domain
MNPDWLRSSTAQVIITPHQKEFESLFGISISEKSLEEKKEMVKKYAREYSIVIILKAVVDIVSDGKEVFII